MKKVLGWGIGLVVLAAVIAIGGIVWPSSGGDAPEVSSITDYRADFDVRADGQMKVVETITVNFPTSRHGIFRFFDTRDPNHSHNRLVPKDITVTRDGSPEEFQVLTEKRGRYRNVKIGSAGTTVFGDHVYRISYTIDGVLTDGVGRTDTQFYWNLVPPGWQMPIARTRLVVHLPAPAETLRCGIGLGQDLDPCNAQGEGTDEVTVVTGALAPHTPVTIRAGLDIPTPAADTLPWSNRLDPVLGRSPVLLGFVALFALGLAAVGAVLSLSTREKPPGFPLMYAPPDGIGPAQAAYLLTEDIDNKAFVATMMYAAENGTVQLHQDGKQWTVTGAGSADSWSELDNVTQNAVYGLGVTAPGQSFTAGPGTVSAGQQLKTSLAAFKSNTKIWSRTAGLMESSGLGGGGCFVLLLAWGATIALGVWNPFDMSILAIIPGLFAITALSVGATGAGTKRTAAGRDLWSRVGGFHRILSTPSAQDRFDFSSRKELYTQYLPWAVAFDCADEWAKKYRLETGEEPPVPVYFGGYTGVHSAGFVNQMVGSFDSAVSSAISSYEATQSSSSSGGGGGFSGGGGGGGGGGGSW
ncbi:DUF2207 domain-containing protein [Marmoricola sp. RAF53]|uniref:DUF2207 domain-containing protein n=1 Tax=Marmoricola sp. RAF53 TaxID=3233059 RepID=UPI003F9754BB